MQSNHIKNVVIVGGGTAGWIAAASMAKLLGNTVSIKLIESDVIGTVGVGEATIPQIRRLNMILGLDENDFIKNTNATFKLGIEFNDWGKIGDRYLHTFGDAGINLNNLLFHHYWLRSVKEGSKKTLWDYSLHSRSAYTNKFGRLERVGNTSMTGLAYAFHFDAALYAKYLRAYSEQHGVSRVEGKVINVNLNTETGFIESVDLERDERISGDLFIDCTGFRALLIGQALGVEYDDWSRWLVCDRAVAVGSEKLDPLIPYTKATAHSAGWQWRIPLQHRVGNGHVFCSSFTNDEEATQSLLKNLDGEPIAEPKVLKFITGRRKKFWHKNCVSLGLASGFLEPLESTSIHLIQSNVSRLLELFPTKDFDPDFEKEYNRLVSREYETVRDFLILHYHQTERDDSEFWNYCRNMDIPDTLRTKIELFKNTGLIYRDSEDLFRESSWVQVMLGQGIMPKSYHNMANRLSNDQLKGFMRDVENIVNKASVSLPLHADYIDAHCRAKF